MKELRNRVAGYATLFRIRSEYVITPVSRTAITVLFFVSLMSLARPCLGQNGIDRIEIIDDMGRKVTVPFPLRRVVVVNAYNVEFVRAIAGTSSILGMDENSARYGDYWPGYRKENNVGKTQSELNYEKIVALNPEAVIIPRNGAWEEANRKLSAFGIPVIVITGWDVGKHVINVETLGIAFDSREKARRMIVFYTHYTDALKTRLKDVARKKVYLENWAKPNISPIPGSGHHDMIMAAGGINIFGDIVLGSQPKNKGSVHDFEIDPERILLEDPDLIIKYNNGQYAPFSEDAQRAILREMVARPGWKELKAVKAGNVHTISNFVAGASSKVVGMVYIAKWLYPELMAGIDPDEALREWIEVIQGVPMKSPYVVSL